MSGPGRTYQGRHSPPSRGSSGAMPHPRPIRSAQRVPTGPTAHAVGRMGAEPDRAGPAGQGPPARALGLARIPLVRAMLAPAGPGPRARARR